ncbi:MAG: RdgB/HAM1 family non-canonical purine NTP pyrophosphatase [Treponema sp.]|jgi:XTP/dITP diphosphohydrolase|nr:RdgB/HAM1 family non-canonical purine NTP pyrophosphatase [Treponema sp.]
MNIWFATNNAHKKEELEAILKFSLKIPSDCGLFFNPEETGTTFCDNALLKARELQKLLGRNEPVISDDSGLCVDALNGRPGVLSARYGNENGVKLTSLQKNIKLLDELGNTQDRSARFVCAMVFLLSADRFFLVQETIEGEIVKKNEMRGEGGFGYDPIFLVKEYGRTLAELSSEDKNAISHRGKAGKRIALLIKTI